MKILFKFLALLALGGSFACAAQNSTKPSSQDQSKAAAPKNDCGTGTVAVQATPEHADILVDGNFVGNSPATLKLAPGKHSLKIAAPGYGEWQRDVFVLGGSESHLSATLQKKEPAETGGAAANSSPSPAAVASTPAPAAAPTTTAASSAPSCGELGAFSDEHPKNRGDGIKVTGFAPRSPAAKAGLEVGDYIVAVAGTYVFTIDDLTAELCKHKPGSQVSLRYRRNAALDETTVVLGP